MSNLDRRIMICIVAEIDRVRPEDGSSKHGGFATGRRAAAGFPGSDRFHRHYLAGAVSRGTEARVLDLQQ